MTSGTLTEVPDKSVFIEYLIKRLEDNDSKYSTSQEMFVSMRTAVINNSPTGQVPQFGEIRETGDEGGDFIFVRRWAKTPQAAAFVFLKLCFFMALRLE